ncbi:MAG TPA: hypothetical protein VK537_02595 [Galbitalea sp.]|nr:hypothetical protein [Galbitalea sp.]
MKKLIAAASTVFIAVALSVVALAAPASAHSATLTGDYVCSNGAAVVTWTIDNDWPQEVTVTASSSQSVIPTGTTVAAKTGSHDKIATFTQNIPAPAAGVSATIALSFEWTDGTQQKNTSASVHVDSSCVVPPTKDASAAIVDTPAACAAPETIAEGAIANATWGTLDLTGSHWSAVATANNGHLFANANGGTLSSNKKTDTFGGTLPLDSALSASKCRLASAAVVTTAPTCQGPETVTKGAIKFATWAPTISYATSGGVTTYTAIATAIAGYQFPSGSGVSSDHLTLTLSGPVSGEVTGHTCEDYIIVAWTMPSWVNSTTPTWSQNYFTSQEESTPNLSALDSQLTEQCGVQYQVDIYYNSPTTAGLIAGHHLDGPSNPTEDLISGGWGTAYKLVQGPACATTATPSESDVCAVGGTITVNSAVGVVYYLNGNPVDTSKGDVVFTGLHGANTVTATAAAGYLLTGYPSGGWSFNINTDCTATYASSGECIATDSNNSQKDVSLNLVNPSSTAATFVVTSTDSTVTGSGSYNVPANSTSTVVVGSVSDSGGTFSVSINGGNAIIVTVDSFDGCIPTTPADPTFTSLTCTGSTANGGTISTDGNPNLTYTLTGPVGFTPAVFPALPATPTIIGLAAGDYTVSVVANPGYILSGATSFPVSITLDAVDCTGTELTPVVSSVGPTCGPEQQITNSQFNAALVEISGTITIPSDPNMTFTINNGSTTSPISAGTHIEPDGTYTVVATLTPTAIADGFTFADSAAYTRSAGNTVATWAPITFAQLCLPVEAAWNAGATATDPTCSTANLGTITLTHSAGQADEVDYVVTNDATSTVVYTGTDSADTVLHVAPGHYTVTASPHVVTDGIAGDAGPYHVTVAAIGALCGDLAFTGGTIGWLGFVLAGGMLFLGIAFLYMKRRGNRTAA